MKSTYYRLGLVGLMAALAACTPDTQLLEDISTPKAEVLNTKLPIARVTTVGGQSIPDEPKIQAELILQQQGQTLFTGRVGIEIRGQSSQMFPKKQYGFETRDDQDDGIDVSLLGFPEEEDWIFHAPYSDKSLMRNALIYDLSREIGRYTTRVQYIDFYLNGRYDGLYLLMEKLKRDKNRIDLNNLKEDENEGDDLTGGYILKIDKESEYTAQNMFESRYDPPLATADQKIRFLFEDPKATKITPQQREYISSYVHAFEEALAGDNFADPETGYAQYIDVDSFVDYFLLNELAQDVDGFRLSTWLVKDKNEKLAMGPIWDFNLAFGNANYCGGNATDVWTHQFNQRCSGDYWLVPFWWGRLLEDPAFKTKVKERWQSLRGSAFAFDAITGRIDAYAAQLNETNNVSNNFARWPVLGAYIWPNDFIGATYEQELNYLKDFINKRLSWLDGAIGAF